MHRNLCTDALPDFLPHSSTRNPLPRAGMHALTRAFTGRDPRAHPAFFSFQPLKTA